MNSRCLELSLNRDTIVSQVSAFLYASGLIHDKEEFIDIKFGDMSEDIVPIKILFKSKESKVTLKII